MFVGREMVVNLRGKVEVVGAVETNNSADKGPDTEGASREASDYHEGKGFNRALVRK